MNIYAGYVVPSFKKTVLPVAEMWEGERIETKIARLMSNEDSISDGAPLIYTDKKDGVLPDYNTL